MGFTGSIIVYVSIWWIVFFSILPLGIKSQNLEFKEQLTGNDPGAPKKPKDGQKILNYYFNNISNIYNNILFG